VTTLIGYARVSTYDQNLELQIHALTKAGCSKIFTEKASGGQRDRPQLKAALEYMRKGDMETRSISKIIKTTYRYY
jgi:DNA invertase Pin-like site-specific DNA recombinase